jgi:hypothetical protein
MRYLSVNSIRRSVKRPPILQIAGTLLVALIICQLRRVPNAVSAGVYPRAAPAGWWNDDGASGKPRIVVHIGEQKAYFYKGKTLVGETTVSPLVSLAFGTPPGHYTVLSKSRGPRLEPVRRLRGWLLGMSLGQISTHERTASRKEPISMARECRMRCSSEAVTRCIRATSRHSPRPTVASVCRANGGSFSRMLPSELRSL